MKKQLIIEVEETSYNSSKSFQPNTYLHEGFYLNTDESGFVNLIFQTKDPEVYPLGFSFNPAMLENIKVVDKIEPLKKEKLVQLPEIVQGISEDALLKAIAIAQKPELLLNLYDDSDKDGKK